MHPFGSPNRGGGWPALGFAVLQLVLVWQAKKAPFKAVAKEKAAEEAAQVRFSRYSFVRAGGGALSGNNAFIHA